MENKRNLYTIQTVIRRFIVLHIFSALGAFSGYFISLLSLDYVFRWTKSLFPGFEVMWVLLIGIVIALAAIILIIWLGKSTITEFLFEFGQIPRLLVRHVITDFVLSLLVSGLISIVLRLLLEVIVFR